VRRTAVVFAVVRVHIESPATGLDLVKDSRVDVLDDRRNG
jgi:hypothetical protein